jgi:hypothetical protein
MDERERALKRIDQVLEMQASPSSAYPIRARLGRAMHEVIRWAEGADRDLPLDLTWLHGSRARAERIVQPSEPFDVRWQREWDAATDDLRIIRIALLNMAE